jgi:hypothetical protein
MNICRVVVSLEGAGNMHDIVLDAFMLLSIFVDP